jgi:hypothetical protein
MDLSYGHEYDAFREEVKSFIRSNKHKQPKRVTALRAKPCVTGNVSLSSTVITAEP